MIDGGIVMIVIGWLIAIVPPAEKLVAGRRAARPVTIGVILRQAYPPVAPTASILELAASADASLQRDDLLRGVRDIGQIYDEA